MNSIAGIGGIIDAIARFRAIRSAWMLAACYISDSQRRILHDAFYTARSKAGKAAIERK